MACCSRQASNHSQCHVATSQSRQVASSISSDPDIFIELLSNFTFKVEERNLNDIKGKIYKDKKLNS